MSLGAIAGGIAQGYMQGEELKLKKSREQREKQAAQREQDAYDREQRMRVAQGAIRMPGDTTDDNYDPQAEAAKRIAEATRPTTPQQRGGLIGAITRHLRPQDAAVGAGVIPPPNPANVGGQMVETAGKLGLPEGRTPGIAPQAPAAAPQGALPTDGTPTLSEVTVTAPGKRKATMVDTLFDTMMAAKAAGASPKEMLPLITQWNDALTKENLQILSGWDGPKIGNRLSKLTGQDWNVQDNDNGTVTVQVGDGPEKTFKTREEAFAQLAGAMGADPVAAMQLGSSFRREAMEEQRLKVYQQQVAGQLRSQATRDVLAARQDTREQGAYEKALADEKQLQASLGVLMNPENAILNPQGYAAASAYVSQKQPKLAEGYAKEGPDTQFSTNTFTYAGQRFQREYAASPYVTGGVIAIAPDQQGNARFWVKGKDGKPVAAASFDDAEAKARKLYGTPKAK